MKFDLPPPIDFGAPAKFFSWRPEQLDFVMRAVNSERRFVAGVLPCGSGKSLVPPMVRALSGEGRMLILTSSRILQSQYATEWDDRVFVIDGQRNHECIAVRPNGALSQHHRGSWKVMVDRAPCHAGVWCKLKQGGCAYYDAVRHASMAPIVVSNYAYWLALGKGALSLGKFDWIVCDEAHAAVAELRRSLHLELSHADLRELLRARPLSKDASVEEWRTWGSETAAICAEGVAEYTRGLRDDGDAVLDASTVAELRRLKALGDTLAQIESLAGDWVVDEPHERGVTSFDPVWPAPYAETLLFRNAPHVLLLSGTMSRKTTELLGVQEAELEFKEYPSSFPAANRPVYIVDLGELLRVRVDNRLKDSGYTDLVALIDAVIARRTDRKIIIHSVSYKLTKTILSRSRYRAHMFSHSSGDAKIDALRQFRNAVGFAILISPSVKVGEDFPMEACETIIIPKIPFVDRSDLVMKRCDESDPGYSGSLMMETLVQSATRHVRSKSDRGEVIILDDHARWAYPRYRRYAPTYFQKAVKWITTLPEPLPKLPAR